MAKQEKKYPKKAKSGKRTPSAPKEKTTAGEKLSTALEGKIMAKQPATVPQSDVALISKDKFMEKIQALRDQTSIKNDRAEEVPFEGEAKELFISAFEGGYPAIELALTSIYELGDFLYDVREKLKPHKLYYAWLDFAGIPQRTATNYVQVYERYTDKLLKFGHLGIKKLLTASRLPNCADYVAENEQTIAEQSAEELGRAVKALRSKRKKTETGRGRKPNYIEIGQSRIRPSMDGTKLIIEGITKKKQAELIEAIKGLLS
jgi:hypothetical protein